MSKNESVHWQAVRDMCLDPSARDYDLTALSDTLRGIIEEVGADEFPDCIANAVEKAIFSPDEGALLLGVATYSTDDEGACILRVLDHWLEIGTDELRVELALSQGTFPFHSRAQRVAVLTVIAKRFPRFADTCRHLIEASPD